MGDAPGRLPVPDVPGPERDDPRSRARTLAAEGHPLLWFETLYREREAGEAEVPWADLRPQPLLVEWLDRRASEGGDDPPARAGTPPRALIVGCGLGDDAEEVARRGFRTVAFDIAPTAVAACRRRFPAGPVEYRVENLIDAPPEWDAAFDLVVEVHTLQVLPESLRALALRRLARFPRPGGTLLVIARGRDDGAPLGELPWPLCPSELAPLGSYGLTAVREEDLSDDEEPPVRRLRVEYRRRAENGEDR